MFDRTNGKPVWPIEERPVPKGDVPGEWYSPTQPLPLDAPRQALRLRPAGRHVDDLIDFTPELRAGGAEDSRATTRTDRCSSRPSFPDQGTGAGKKGSIHMPGTYGGTNWPGARARSGDQHPLRAVASRADRRAARAAARRLEHEPRAARPGNRSTGRSGLPLFKPPYGRLVAIDLNKGEIKWTVANGDGPRDHPALKHLNLPPLGNPGRVGPMVTSSLVFMGEGFNTAQRRRTAVRRRQEVPRVRQDDRRSGVGDGARRRASTAPPMTYLWQGKQYIVVATGWTGHPGELVALALD